MQAKHIFFLLFPISGFADVNMRDASFTHSVNEFTHPIFSKTYNSRSLYQGTFGFGWCAEFEKTLSPKDGTRYHCGRMTKVQIQSMMGDWVATLPGGAVEIYDSNGLLKGYKKVALPLARIRYNSKKKIESISIAKEKFDFHYEPRGGRLREINGRLKSKYVYKDQNLAEIQNSKSTFLYTYDSFHNLVQILYPQKKAEKITYDIPTDEVQTVSTSNGCFEIYRFQKISQIELKSSFERNCPSALPQKKTISFIAKRTPQGSLVIEKIKVAGGKNGNATLP